MFVSCLQSIKYKENTAVNDNPNISISRAIDRFQQIKIIGK
jgi:hypothetical protein